MKKIVLLLLVFFCSLSLLAAEQKFSSLTGQEFSYKELISGPKTVFLTWAVWCPYCVSELERLAESCIFFEGVEVYFINIGDSKSVTERFAASRNFKDCIREKIILDPQGYIANEFNIIGIPTYVFFKDGQPITKSYFLDSEMLEDVFSQ